MKYTLKEEWMEGINNLPSKIQAEVLGAIVMYQHKGVVPELSVRASMAFTMILPSVKDFMDKSEKMAENGKRKAATKAAATNENTQKDDIVPDDNPLLEFELVAPEVKPTQEEKYQYAANVRIKPSDYQLLVEQYGDEGATWMVNKLAHYKKEYHKRYKDDYSAINKWVIEAYLKELNSNATRTIPALQSKSQFIYEQQQKSNEIIRQMYDK